MLYVRNYINKLPRHPTRKYRTRDVNRIRNVIVHTTVPFTSPEEVAKFDISPTYRWPDGKVRPNPISPQGCPACTYHYLIDNKGEIYQALYHKEVSWHAPPLNTVSVAIGLMYSPLDPDGKDRGNVSPSQAMYDSAVALCAKICGLKSLLRNVNDPGQIKGHREVLGSGHKVINGVKKYRRSCPGWAMDMDSFRADVAAKMQEE